MLKRHLTTDELSASLEYMTSHPRAHQFLAITETIKVELSGVFTYNQLRLYSYEVNETKYWFAQRNYDIVRPMTYTEADGPIVDSELAEAFLALNEVEHLTDNSPRIMLTYNILYKEKIVALLLKHGGATPFKMNNVIRFYMDERQMQQTNEYKSDVPEGYELGSATPEDADFITNNWQHAGKGDDEQTRRKVQSLPSSCIRYNGQIVAFEIADPAAMLNNQFVVPEHRNKGLGKLVEMDLSQKLIRLGYTVYKHVDVWNTHVVDYSARSKYFTRSTLEDGEGAMLTYVVY